MKYLLDTNIISEPTRPRPNQIVIQHLELKNIFSCTSATAWMELWKGIHLLQSGKRKQLFSTYLEELLAKDFTVLPFCQDAAEWLASESVRLQKRGITPGKYDSEIAAVAVVHDLTLVTRNTDDFEIFDALKIENWFDN